MSLPSLPPPASRLPPPAYRLPSPVPWQYDDVVVGGLATLVHVTAQRSFSFAPLLRGVRAFLTWSSFYRPLVTRSMCVTHVALGLPECPGYASTFVRDLPSHMEIVFSSKKRLLRQAANGRPLEASEVDKLRAHAMRSQRWTLLGGRGMLPATCRNRTIPACYHSFTSALK